MGQNDRKRNGRNPKNLRNSIALVALIIITGLYGLFTWDGLQEQKEEQTQVQSVYESSPDELPEQKEEPSQVQYSDESSRDSQPEEREKTLFFRNEELLKSHYEKHGVEMGFASAKEYEEAANRVVLNSASLHKLEAEDGDDVYYLEETNEFVIVSVDGYLRTYFCPEDGIDYYNRQ